MSEKFAIGLIDRKLVNPIVRRSLYDFGCQFEREDVQRQHHEEPIDGGNVVVVHDCTEEAGPE